jgi:hypothetical protein
MRSLVALVSVVAVFAAGCSSNYVPKQRGRVGVTMSGGQFAYVRDGQSHTHGLFGGGLVDAVQGVPAAVDAAEEYNDRVKIGFLVSVGGALCATIAMGYAIGEDLDSEGEADVATEALLALGCLVASLGGVGYIASAEPYRWDAINIFNDTMAAQYPGYPPAPAPVFTPAGPPGADAGRARSRVKKLSLKMP